MWPRRRRARSHERQLAAVDVVEVELPGGSEDDDGAARRHELERRRRGTQHRSGDRAVRRPARPVRPLVEDEDVVAASSQDLGEEPSDEALTDHDDTAGRHALGAAENAGQRLYVRRAGVVERGRHVDGLRRADTLGEAAGHDRRRGELVARRLVPRQAPVTRAARAVVDKDDAPRVSRLGDDLVAEDAARELRAQLLDVRAAEPAREHAEGRAAGLLDIREPRAAGRV